MESVGRGRIGALEPPGRCRTELNRQEMIPNDACGLWERYGAVLGPPDTILSSRCKFWINYSWNICKYLRMGVCKFATCHCVLAKYDVPNIPRNLTRQLPTV